MYALNLNNGDTVWTYHTSKVIHSSPAIYNGKIYFGCWNNKLYALDAFTGTKLWEYQTADGIPSSPTVIDSFVFIGSRDANVYAINANTGHKIWSRSFNGSWMPSSFAIQNDTVYTGSSDAKRFYALNKINGQILYSVSLPCYAFSTPAYSNGTIFIGCMNGSLYSIDTRSHDIITRFDTQGHIDDVYNALNDNGTFNTAVVKDPQYVSMMFSTGSVASTPVIDNGIIYFGSSDSCLYAVYAEEVISDIHDVIENKFARIYPNPSSNFINIQTSEKLSLIRIYDSKGTTCKLAYATNNSMLDISTLDRGFYFIVLTTNDGKQLTEKFVKQ
jgi:eukaryotic-like serine/threonine-protein kinase